VYGDLVYVADQTGMGIYDCSESINVVPQWVDIPRDTVEFTSGDLIEFDLTSRDRNDDELTLDLALVDLPDNIEFTDNGDGSAGFSWQTTMGDSAIYHPIFIASDGELNDSVEVVFLNSIYYSVETDDMPVSYEILQIYPNPFNSTTHINYSLDVNADVTISLFDLSGKEVSRLVDRPMTSGKYNISWDASDLPSGIYLCRLSAGSKVKTTKLALIK